MGHARRARFSLIAGDDLSDREIDPSAVL